jgi:hypothetical protein
MQMWSKTVYGWMAALVLLVLPVIAMAQSAQSLPPVLENLQKDGALLEFMGHSYGVDGWRIVNKAGDAKYAYVTPEGGVLLGILLRPDGAMETNNQLRAIKSLREGGQAALPGADQAKSAKVERIYAQIEKSNWAAIGDKSKPYIYVFVNMDCEHCKAYWKDLQKPIASGRLQVRVVPYGRNPLNHLAGAAFLSVDDPNAAWLAFIGGDRAALGKDKIKGDAEKKVDANTDLYFEWKLGVPPLTMYRRPSDGQIIAIPGRPENTMLVLAELMGG